MQIPAPTPHEDSTSRGVYQFWRDPICLLSWAIYILNRLILIPHLGIQYPFLYEHLNDSLLVPAALPPFVWARQRLRLRRASGFPTIREIIVTTLIASIVFEWLGPRYIGRSVGDWNDVAVYWLGAAVSALCWSIIRRSTKTDKISPL